MTSLLLHRLRLTSDGPTHSVEISAGVFGIVLDSPLEVDLLGSVLLGVKSAKQGRVLWSGTDPESSPILRQGLFGVLPEEDLASCPREILARFEESPGGSAPSGQDSLETAPRVTRETLLKSAVRHVSASGHALLGLVLCAPFDFEEEAESIQKLIDQNPELLVVYLSTSRRELLVRTGNCIDLRRHPTISRPQHGLRVIADRPRELLRALSHEPSLLGFFENPERPRELLLWSIDPDATLAALQKSILRSEVPVHEISSFGKIPHGSQLADANALPGEGGST